jgi:hypothetical protein
MKTILVLALLLCLFSLSCDDKSPSSPAASSGGAVSTAPAEIKELPVEYAIAIEESTTEPKTYSVKWSAQVNSGGWGMKTETVLVEELNGAMACRIWVTLTQPHPTDVVSQGIETLTAKHDAGTTKIERVEFSARRMVSGVTPAYAPLYSVVKTIKYPY